MAVSDRLAALDGLWAAHSTSAGAADAVYATLREAIISGLLRPGDNLIEEHIARQFGVSRTPVREALLRLEAEHLARRIPRRGLVVHTISEHQVLEVYTVRTALDSLAARLAASEALPAEIAHLRWINQRLAEAVAQDDDASMSDLTTEFHLALARAAHNGILLHFTEQIHGWVMRLGTTTFAYPGRPALGLEEHERLIEALTAHDPEAAERVARQHMAGAHQIRIAMLLEKASPDGHERQD